MVFFSNPSVLLLYTRVQWFWNFFLKIALLHVVLDWQAWVTQSVMSATYTLGLLGCMWLACCTLSSAQWINVCTLKLKDIVDIHSSQVLLWGCVRAPQWGSKALQHCDTDQLGPLVMRHVGSSPSDGSVQSIQTTCPHFSVPYSCAVIKKGQPMELIYSEV